MGLAGSLVGFEATLLATLRSPTFSRAGSARSDLVGAFPSGAAIHVPIAVGCFALLTFSLWIHGTGAIPLARLGWTAS